MVHQRGHEAVSTCVFISRQTSESLELDGYEIPKGMQVGIDIRSIHRNPDTWENPNEYDPLRFHPSNTEGCHPFAYTPFSGGQRNCIGQNFLLIHPPTGIRNKDKLRQFRYAQVLKTENIVSLHICVS